MSTRDNLVARMVRSGANLWLLYLGAKIFEQLNKSPRHAAVRPFVHWMNICDEKITNALDTNCSVEALENRLSVLLEVSLVHYLLVQNSVFTQSLACILEVRSY